ncbi:MAG: flippase [Candidatus Melainabacteria bacterium]|nr:flippase [Candidatus Melainabacteria bacterium]
MKKEPLSKKLTFGIFYLLSSSFATLGLNVITVGFIARTLGVEQFGLYSAIFSFVGLFQFFSDFGINKTLLKFGSTEIKNAQASFGNALFVKSILIVPTIFLVIIFGLIAGYRNNEIIIVTFFIISLIFDSYGTLFSSIRRILGSFKLISFFRVLRTCLNLIIIICALSIKSSVFSLALAIMIFSLVTFLISLINTVMLLKPKLQLNLLNEFFKDSVIFSFSDFFLGIYAKISTVLLSFFSDLHSVGIYGAAIRFTRIANLLPNQVKFALLPTMYRLLGNNNNDTYSSNVRVFKILFKYMTIFATPLVISIYFFSDSIIHLIFGKKYDLAIPLVKLFSLFIYLRFVETPFNLFYIAMNKHKKMVYFQGITSGLSVILNLILIPKFFMYGAAAATIISEIVFALMLVFSGIKYSIWDLQNIFVLFLKPLTSGLLALFLTLFFLSKINIFVQIIFLYVSYLLFLFVTRLFNKEDKDLFMKIIARE